MRENTGAGLPGGTTVRLPRGGCRAAAPEGVPVRVPGAAPVVADVPMINPPAADGSA